MIAALRRGFAAMRSQPPPLPALVIAQPMEAALCLAANGTSWQVGLLNPWTRCSTFIEFDGLPIALSFVNELRRVGGVEYQVCGIPEGRD